MDKSHARYVFARTSFVLALIAALIAGALGSASQAEASASKTTICNTLNLSADFWNGALSAIRPHMTAPVCYDGEKIWRNGAITPGVTLFGYKMEGGYSWYGTYAGDGSWIGVGENYTVSTFNGWVTFSCATRWIVDAHGKVLSYDRGC